MLVLGIETSCDETSAAVVREGEEVCANVTASSAEFHSEFGGIVPEVATRHQVECISYVVEGALKKAGKRLEDIGLISVTQGPGLAGALLVGISMAKALAFGARIPLVGVNHIKAHIYAALLEENVEFPVVGFVISGGHTVLVYVNGVDDWELLGTTRDDAVGEVYDKVAKILGLGYPGGPVIERLAETGDSSAIRFPRARMKGRFDFSFSGVKTSVLYYVREHPVSNNRKLISDICAGFQCAVMDVLVEKAMEACLYKKVKSLVIGGGVSANKVLRRRMKKAGQERGIEVCFPLFEYSLDNAAMVAGLGYRLYREGRVSDFHMEAVPNMGVDG